MLFLVIRVDLSFEDVFICTIIKLLSLGHSLDRVMAYEVKDELLPLENWGGNIWYVKVPDFAQKLVS